MLSKQEREEIIAVLMMRKNYSLEFLDGLEDKLLVELYTRDQ